MLVGASGDARKGGVALFELVEQTAPAKDGLAHQVGLLQLLNNNRARLSRQTKHQTRRTQVARALCACFGAVPVGILREYNPARIHGCAGHCVGDRPPARKSACSYGNPPRPSCKPKKSVVF